MAERFQEHFGKTTDPQVERAELYTHPLEEILFALLCGSICGPLGPHGLFAWPAY